MVDRRAAPANSVPGDTGLGDGMLRELLEQTLAISGASAAQLTTFGPDRRRAVQAVAMLMTPRGIESARTGLDGGSLGSGQPGTWAGTAWCEDIAAEAGEPLVGLLNGRKLAGVRLPLLRDGGVRGCLFLGFDAPRTPDKESLPLLEALGRQAALTAAIVQRADELMVRVDQSRVLVEMARVSTSTLQLDEMLERLVRAAAQLTGADRASIWLLAGDGETLLPSAMFGVDEAFLQSWKQGGQRLIDQTLSREALESGRPVVVLDAASDPRTDKTAVQFFGDKSLLIAPLMIGDRAIGTLYLNHVNVRHHYTPGDIQAALAIASQATAAIENARLYRESENQRRRMRASFRRLGIALGSERGLDDTLRFVVDIAADIMGAQACVLELHEEPGGEPRVQASSGLSQNVAERLRLSRVGTSLDALGPERVTRDLARLVPSDDGVQAKGGQITAGSAYFAIPLSIGGKEIGSLAVVGKPGQAFTPEDTDILSGFAVGAALAIQRSRLQAEVESRLEHFASLYSLSQAISTLGDFNQTLAHVVDQVAAVLQVERCVILLLDEDRENLVGHTHAFGLTHTQAASIVHVRDDARVTWQVLETGVPFVSNDCEHDTRITPKYVQEFGDKNLLIAPMRVGETPVGVIRASNRRPPGFTEGDAKLMNIFATEAAVIVQNAMLYRDATRQAEQLEAVISEASDGIVITDSSGRILRFNAAMEEICGWPAKEAVGKDCDVVIAAAPGAQAVGGALLIKRVLETGELIPYSETVVWHRQGRPVDVGASYSIIMPHRGASLMAVAIVRDISAIKEVDRMKSDFVSLVSHEFRTPLALIKGYIATLLRPDLNLKPETVARFQTGINEAADRLVLIVNNLLNTSRIESGLFRPNLRPTDLRPLITRVIADLQESSHDRLESVWQGDDFNVPADAEQISLVLNNLIGNAIKYGRGEHDLAIRVNVEARPEHVKVIVSDKGPGIPPQLKDKVFEKFYRGPSGVRVQGTGLGLYICKEVVRAHGGDIGIENEEEPGTTIAFTLPRAKHQPGASLDQ